MTPLKELAFSDPWGENDRVGKTGKGSWTKKSEDNGERGGGGMGFPQTADGVFSKFSVMLWMP